jgi:hypothetical protein
MPQAVAPVQFYGMHYLSVTNVARRPDIRPFFRYPQWGIRIHCEKLPSPEVNL